MATLCAKDADKWGCNQWVREGKAVLSNPTVTAFDAFNQVDTGDLSKTVAARNDQDTASLVAQPISFGAQMSVPQTDVDLVQTLQATNPMAVAIQGTLIGRSENAGPQGSGADVSGAMFTLTKADVHAVAFGVGEQPDIGHCLRSGASKADKHESTTYVAQGAAMQVRRLTAEECEKLQGFLPGYTNIPWRGKPESPDGPRYKALGNSMAVPVMSWIGERINEVSKL